ncbi:MAG: hypothetical protein DMG64_19120 [Acidobacteria bacterium]|nr:MAG: hypothetical protein DMG64_19120 [Acidobacteriota bacterium]
MNFEKEFPMAKKRKTAPAKATLARDQAAIQLNVFDGTRQPFPSGKNLLIRILDGSQTQLVSRFYKKSSFEFDVPFSDNFKDNYTVLVTCDGYRDAGFFPVKVSPDAPSRVDLMLVPKRARYRFPSWDELKADHQRFADFLNCERDVGTARTRYDELRQSREPALASLLNLTAAMSGIHLPVGTPLDYFMQIEWAASLAQDRFFGFADAEIVNQVKTAWKQGEFEPEASPGIFHDDATSSYKQIQFGEANVQLTFHENTVKTIAGIKCIRVEPDIDYYRDPAAHALLEVIPNTLSHGLTDPQVVYVLRWIAGRHAGVQEFDPGYVLVE